MLIVRFLIYEEVLHYHPLTHPLNADSKVYQENRLNPKEHFEDSICYVVPDIAVDLERIKSLLLSNASSEEIPNLFAIIEKVHGPYQR